MTFTAAVRFVEVSISFDRAVAVLMRVTGLSLPDAQRALYNMTRMDFFSEEMLANVIFEWQERTYHILRRYIL